MAIITSLSRWHGMALFLSWCCFIDVECHFSPSRISTCSKWASYNPYVMLVVQNTLSYLCIFIFSKAQTRGSSLVLFQVQSLFNNNLFLFFLPHWSFFWLKEDKRYPLSKGVIRAGRRREERSCWQGTARGVEETQLSRLGKGWIAVQWPAYGNEGIEHFWLVMLHLFRDQDLLSRLEPLAYPASTTRIAFPATVWAVSKRILFMSFVFEFKTA